MALGIPQRGGTALGLNIHQFNHSFHPPEIFCKKEKRFFLPAEAFFAGK